MKLGSWLGMVAALTLPLLGAATAPGLTQSDSQQANCANPVTTLDMGLCSGQKAEAADRKLNHVYQQLRQKLSGQQRQGLTSAQQAWIKFRGYKKVIQSCPAVNKDLSLRTNKPKTRLDNFE